MSNKIPAVFLGGFLLFAGEGEGAQVRGRVRLEGPVPEPEFFTIHSKGGQEPSEGCGPARKRSQKLLVDATGGVENAVVWLDVPPADSPAEGNAKVILDQKECLFIPHVVLLTPGQFLSIRNSDPVLHNVRIFRESRAEDVRSAPLLLLHQWQKAGGAELSWLAPEPGRYVVRCGVHPWMYGWVIALSSAAGAVTGPSGSFEIEAVPAGRWTLHVWHETLGRVDFPIEVGPDPVEIPVPFRPKEGR